MRYLLFLIFVVFCTGCASSNLQLYSNVDTSNKTVTVPPGSKGLKGELKKALSKAGWTQYVDRGPIVSEPDSIQPDKVQHYDTFHTKYRLLVISDDHDICFNLSPLILYEISFIDNETGTEVFTLEGDDCQNKVVAKFINLLKCSKEICSE